MAYITCKKCGSQMSDKSEICPLCGWPAGSQPRPDENRQVGSEQLSKGQAMAMFYSLLSITFSLASFGIQGHLILRLVPIIIGIASGVFGIIFSNQEQELSKKQPKNIQNNNVLTEIPLVSLIVSILSIVFIVIRLFLLIRFGY